MSSQVEGDPAAVRVSCSVELCVEGSARSPCRSRNGGAAAEAWVIRLASSQQRGSSAAVLPVARSSRHAPFDAGPGGRATAF